eukprot:jgi/Tetstr1/440193/TSEL_028545.t1
MSAAGEKGASAKEGCCELEETCAVISRHDVQVMHDLLAAAIGSFSSASQPCGEGGGEVERRRLPGMSARTAAGGRVSADAASDGRMAGMFAALAAEREADAERTQAAASPHGASGARGSSPSWPPCDAESHESVEFVSVSGDERAERNFLQHAERAILHTPRRQQGVGSRQSVGSAGQRSLSDMGWLRPSQQPEAAPSSKPLQQCPVCGHEFPRNANNRSINQHMDKCLNLLAMDDADIFS